MNQPTYSAFHDFCGSGAAAKFKPRRGEIYVAQGKRVRERRPGSTAPQNSAAICEAARQRESDSRLCAGLWRAGSIKILLFPLAFFISILLAPAQTYQPALVMPPSPAREFRAAWIATVGNKDWPSAPGLSVAQQKAELISLLDTAARLKLNAIVFQVRPACDAMYASSLEPWSEYLTGGQGRPPQPYYDPLAFAIEEAHKRGLELHAWFNPFRARLTLTAPAAANGISRTHPQWVRSYGEQLWLDPGDPAVRAYSLNVIMDVVRRYNVDGVQFDDYYYPYPAKNSAGVKTPFPDDATWRNYGERSGLSRDDWRRQNVNEFIESVYQNIKAVKPWVKFGIAPFGIWQPGYPPQIKGFNAYTTLYCDSRLWLMSGWLDYCSPQLYWPINSPGQSFPVLLNWWEKQNVRGRNLWPGLAAYSLGPKFPAAEIGRQIQAIRQLGAGGEIFFEMKNLRDDPVLANVIAGEYTQPALVPASPWLDTVLPARPELACRVNRGSWNFQWTTFGGNPVANWVLQFCGPDYAWRTAILPAYQTSQTFSFAPTMVSVRAMDRADNLGPPAVLKQKVAQSFWGSGKWK
jgi:uncharacterized lipoprotein YddW (UPF0748 family)